MPVPPLICWRPTSAHNGIDVLTHIVEKSPKPMAAMGVELGVEVEVWLFVV